MGEGCFCHIVPPNSLFRKEAVENLVESSDYIVIALLFQPML